MLDFADGGTSLRNHGEYHRITLKYFHSTQILIRYQLHMIHWCSYIIFLSYFNVSKCILWTSFYPKFGQNGLLVLIMSIWPRAYKFIGIYLWFSIDMIRSTFKSTGQKTELYYHLHFHRSGPSWVKGIER